MWRGCGRTDVMLRGALLAALAGKTVLVTMLGDQCVRHAQDILARIAARRTTSPAALTKVSVVQAALSRITIVSVDDEERRMRGRRFDVHVADHAVLIERMPRTPGDEWLR